MLYFPLFLFGLVTGSFLNCVIYRLETGSSFLKGRSFCPHCKHKLSWLDLIPVLGFVFLQGKCRYCKKKISLQYPLVELATGFLFILAFWYFGFGISLIPWLFILSSLLAIFVYDLKHYIIPDSLVFAAIVVAAVFNFNLLAFLSAFGAAGFFLAIVLISRGKWMGVGDIKLAFLMGLMLGWPAILLALFLAFSIGAIIGLGLMAVGRKTLRSEVPFGPFLVTGTLIALFWGEIIIEWYLQLTLT